MLRSLVGSEMCIRDRCYKCQGYEHLAASCPSLVKITIIDGTPTKATESDSDEYTYYPDVKTDGESSSDDVGLNCIRPTLSTHLSIVKCVLSHQQKRSIGELRSFTCSSRLETRVVR